MAPDVTLERLYTLVSEQLPEALRALAPDAVGDQRWMLVDAGDDDAELSQRPSGGEPPVREAFELVSNDPDCGAIVVSRAIDPVEHVLGYALVGRTKNSTIRRADVLREGGRVQLGPWRWLG